MKQTLKSDVAQPALAETCLYCGRVRWGNYQYLGKGLWRHEECSPGSTAWREWYDRRGRKTRVGEYLRPLALTGRRGTRNAED